MTKATDPYETGQTIPWKSVKPVVSSLNTTKIQATCKMFERKCNRLYPWILPGNVHAHACMHAHTCITFFTSTYVSIGHGVLFLVRRSSTAHPDKDGLASVQDEHILGIKGTARDSTFRDQRELELASLITETEERFGEGSRVIFLREGNEKKSLSLKVV